ncbi:MAG: signal peptidase I [Gemmatimonadaceae bacterium]
MSGRPHAHQTESPSITAQRKAHALRALNRTRSPFAAAWDFAKSFQIAVLLFLLVRPFVEAFKIPSGSMERTLQVGDFLLVNKLVYGAEVPFTGRRFPAWRRPDRGDVIVFQFPKDRTKNFVKRLVGLPGDTLAMREGVLSVNGSAQRERYAVHSEPPEDDRSTDDFEWQRCCVLAGGDPRIAEHPSRNNWGPLVVPERNYFVLGDNRDNSYDSRYWGLVPDSLVRGRPMVIYYSYAPDTAHSFAWLTHIRWDRLGETIP